jgi:hypothetical protein
VVGVAGVALWGFEAFSAGAGARGGLEVLEARLHALFGGS